MSNLSFNFKKSCQSLNPKNPVQKHGAIGQMWRFVLSLIFA
jgi:hypothetical protein